MDQRNGLVALIDMDGTVADYDSALQRDLRLLLSPGETLILPHTEKEEAPYLKQRVKLIRNQPGWWRALAPITSGLQIVEILRKLGFALNVLTKGPRSNSNSWTEKREWCLQYLPDALVTVTEDKSLVYGKILVDDWPAYAESWLKWRPRGWVIMPAHPWNLSFEHPRVIRYDSAQMSLEELEAKITQIVKNAASDT